MHISYGYSMCSSVIFMNIFDSHNKVALWLFIIMKDFLYSFVSPENSYFCWNLLFGLQYG